MYWPKRDLTTVRSGNWIEDIEGSVRNPLMHSAATQMNVCIDRTIILDLWVTYAYSPIHYETTMK